MDLLYDLLYYPVTKVSCEILMKYFMMFAPIIWLWASISFAWILLASRKKTELCENEKQAAAIFVIAFLMKQIIKDRVCYHYRYHYRYRYRCPCD